MSSGKITIRNFSGKRIDGIITNQLIEITPQYQEAIAEAVLQVLYNIGTYSNIELNYDLEIEGGTKYYVHGTDVTVVPTTQDPYTRRIRNNPNIISKDRKDDNLLNEIQRIERNQ